jgi:high-affinity iron transporter
LTGGGLSGPKTVSVGGLASDWATPQADDNAVANAIAQSAHDRSEATLWTRWLPTSFAIAAALLLLTVARGRRISSKREREQQNDDEDSERVELRVS